MAVLADAGSCCSFLFMPAAAVPIEVAFEVHFFEKLASTSITQHVPNALNRAITGKICCWDLLVAGAPDVDERVLRAVASARSFPISSPGSHAPVSRRSVG